MKLLACCKVVPDLEMLTREDWAVRDMEVELRFAKLEWNIFDESLLEMALRLRDAVVSGIPGDSEAASPPASAEEEGLHLTALNIGDSRGDPFLKNLLALSFDRAVRIESGEDLRFSPRATAGMISRYVEEHPQDLVLFGRRSGVGDNGQTPLLTAELLGLPCITQVRAFRPAQAASWEGRIIVENYTDDGIQEQEILPPCVLAIGNAEQTYLRIPTLRDKMNFGSRSVEVLSPGEFMSSPEIGEGFRLTGLEGIDTDREGLLIREGSAEEKARRVYDLYLHQRLEKLWTAR